MKERLRYVWSLLFAIAIVHPAEAQPNEAAPIPASTKAADLVITPRVGVGYTTPGGGYDGFANIQGFIPLKQTLGKDLLFLEGRFLLDNDANPGGSLVLGYRTYQAAANRIYGAYLAYDNRDTGSNVFSQVGLGLETLGEGWDARVNGYIPAGSTRQTVRETTIVSNNSVSSIRFQTNRLVASVTRQQLTMRDVEAAMAGFDAEIGGRLVKFPDDGGDLRGYGGLYYLSAAGSPSVVGVRGRLEARVTDNLLLGVALQHDELFGTNVFGTISLTLPGVRPKGAAPKSVIARMAESPTRIGTIAIDQQRETTNITLPVSDLAIENPATGQPYLFQHVTVGRSGGDGTFENPFGLIDPALAATRSDGNSIVYVQAGNNSEIPAFTIRDRVQVLSTFPTQIIPAAFQGQRIPDVRLEFSGIGAVRPLVNGTITMGSDTVLSGFNITSATGAGVTFTNVNQVDIRDNVIRNTADAGILGNGVAVANLFRNQITSAQNQGVYIQNVGTVTITDNAVSGTIAGTTTIGNPITGDITIGSITIPNPGSIIPLPSGQGIVIATAGNTNISRNTVTGTATQGIVLLNAIGNVAIADNSIANTVGADFTTNIPPLGNITLTTGQGIVAAGVNGTLDVSRNTVNNVRGQGIAVAAVLNGTTTIANNTVRNAVDQGIVIAGTSGTTNITTNQISDVTPRPVAITVPILGAVTLSTGQGLALINSIGTVNVTGNTIERVLGILPLPTLPGGQGIQVANFSGQLDLNIINNQFRNNDNDGILIGLAGRPSGTTTAAIANITISNNAIENNGGAAPVRGDGVAIAIEQDAVINNLLIENNIIRGNGDEGIDIRLGSQAAPLGLNPTSARLTGAIRNNTITNNGQNGIQVEARGDTIAKIAIESNNSSNNGQRGIFVTTSNIFLLGPPQISADIRLNTLTANTGGGTQVLTTTSTLPPSAPQSICVNLTGNISTNGSAITNTDIFTPFISNIITVVNLAFINVNNTGGVVVSGTPAPTTVPACP